MVLSIYEIKVKFYTLAVLNRNCTYLEIVKGKMVFRKSELPNYVSRNGTIKILSGRI